MAPAPHSQPNPLLNASKPARFTTKTTKPTTEAEETEPAKPKTEAEETRPNTDAAKPRTAKRQGQILPPPFGLPASPPLSDKQRKLEKEMVHLVSLNLVPPARASPTSFIFKHPSAYGADDSARLKDFGLWRQPCQSTRYEENAHRAYCSWEQFCTKLPGVPWPSRGC